MGVVDWIQVIVLGGIVGALGQGARVIVGLKKLNDESAAKGPGAEPIEASRLITSLFIGFIAGALAAVTMGIKSGDAVSQQQLLGLAGAGYAGTDFIEGLVNRTPMSPPASAVTLPVGAQVQAAAATTTGSATLADDYLG